VQLFPNPVCNELYINLSNDLLFQKALIYNNLGQVMIESQAQEINVSKLQGINFVQITTDKGNAVKKIIVK
jgi:hypothetical protein